MPAWWGRKSSKQKQETQQTPAQNPDKSPRNGTVSSLRNDVKRKDKDKPRSFDESSPGLILSRNSPRSSKDYAGGSSGGFLGFDSDRGVPLPRPSVSDHGPGLGSGSVSVSSVSSSGSSDDHVVAADPAQLGGFRHMEINYCTRARSPGPGSRGATSPTSPLHPRLSGVSVDSATGRLEDGKNQCHKLPLPPGSPTSPSAMPLPPGSPTSPPAIPLPTGSPPSPSAMPLPPGSPSSPSAMSNARMSAGIDLTPNLSKWKKGKLLGRGTFGHVYQGFNSESGQMCAIKEVKVVSDDHTSKECLKQLNQEINLLSQLSHPNIVQYYGSELVEDSLSVYLEYVSGGSIHKLLQEYGPFKEPVIQNYTRQILSGLAYLHSRNTVHRDIKGANILVDPNGEIKLADFGMAKHITSASSMLSFKGSPYWMAPEVVMNTNGYSLEVDIWSLGCTILEMATSKPPWSQYEGVAAIFKIGNSKDMPEIPNHLSNEAKDFIKLCLHRDPALRPSAMQLLDHQFLRDQAATRLPNINMTRDAFPYPFDGSRTPPALDLHPRRMSMSSGDKYATKPVPITSRALKSPKDNLRAITSLPVSPCSSPLRQYGPLHKSCLLSPPHPAYTQVGQNGFNFSAYPTRQSTNYTLDPFQETPLFRSQTPPGGSPRRFI